jgi:general stress protein YciG
LSDKADDSISCREAGRRGGQARREQEPDYRKMGQIGGATTKRKYGLAHYQDIGKKGGAATAKKHGREHFKQLGSAGGSRTAARVKQGQASE